MVHRTSARHHVGGASTYLDLTLQFGLKMPTSRLTGAEVASQFVVTSVLGSGSSIFDYQSPFPQHDVAAIRLLPNADGGRQEDASIMIPRFRRTISSAGYHASRG